jgi:hypothetical protein
VSKYVSISGKKKTENTYKYVSISGKMKIANTNKSIKITVAIKQVMQKINKGSNDIGINGNKVVHKYTRAYSKPVRRVNMWYVNKRSTLCTQSVSQQLGNVQAQASRASQLAKSSKLAEICGDIAVYRLVRNIEYEVKMSAYVKSPCNGHRSKVNKIGKTVERNSSIQLVKKRYGIVRAGTCLCNVKCNSGSDFPVILTMNVPPLDKTGKVDPMAVASGEMVVDQTGIPASNGKKCPSEYSNLNAAFYDVEIKLYLFVSEIWINIVLMCYVTLCMLNPNLFVIIYIGRLIECECNRCNLALARYPLNINMSYTRYTYVTSINTQNIKCVAHVPIGKGGGPADSTYMIGSIRSNWKNRYRE